MKHILLILILILSTFPAVAQDADEEEDEVDYIQMKVDRILSLIKPDTPDTLKRNYYHDIGNISDNYDTAMKYASLSLEYCKDTDFRHIADNNYTLAFNNYYKGEYRNTLTYAFKAIEFYEKIGNDSEVAHCYTTIAKCYAHLNINDSIFYYYDKVLDIYTALNDTAALAYTYESIGTTNFNLGFQKNAAEYFEKALNLYSSIKDYPAVATEYATLGATEYDNDKQKALDYLKKSVEIFDTIPAKRLDMYLTYQKYNAYYIIAQIYNIFTKENIQYADSSYFYIKKIGNRFLDDGFYDMHSLVLQCYALYLSYSGKYKEAVAVMDDCKQYLDSSNSAMQQYYESFYEISKYSGDYKNALTYHEKLHEYQLKNTNDSTLNVIANFKTEQATKIHEEETKRLKAEQKQMRTAIFSLIGGLVLVSLLVFFIVCALNIKRKANRELSEKNQQLDHQKSEILAQRDEIATQKEIITQQWQEVEEVNKKLVSSINYAQRIQTAAISLQSEVDALFPENFVYYKPRDIVSGDYYRVANCGKYRVLITADCTGHGIPGAFLSMLGISALKEYCVTEDDAANPGIILDHMREFIKTTLVSSTKKTIDDGMDMTICCYDLAAMEMRYAAANQSAYIVRNGEAIRLKGDRMPVGRYVLDNKHFATHIQPIEHGDMIYTFSDGIQDQPGGELDNELGKKFLTKNLVKLLTEIAPKPLAEQRDIIDKTITKWRNGRPQVDDITMIGIRV